MSKGIVLFDDDKVQVTYGSYTPNSFVLTFGRKYDDKIKDKEIPFYKVSYVEGVIELTKMINNL